MRDGGWVDPVCRCAGVGFFEKSPKYYGECF